MTPTVRTRMTPRERREDVLSAALRLAVMHGYTHITRDDIAMAAGCSPALVSQTLGTMRCLRRALVRAAVAREVLPVIAQGLALRDPHALRAPEELRVRAAGSLAP